MPSSETRPSWMGGPTWERDGLPTTTDVPTVTPIAYSANVSSKLFVSREYVERGIDRASIIDVLDADVYFGVTTERAESFWFLGSYSHGNARVRDLVVAHRRIMHRFDDPASAESPSLKPESKK